MKANGECLGDVAAPAMRNNLNLVCIWNTTLPHTQASTRTVGGQENGPGNSTNSSDHSQPHQCGATRTTAVSSRSSCCSTGSTMSRSI